jgi:DNA-binding GntR family transcriptional regulator
MIRQKSIPLQIIDFIKQNDLEPGAHLPSQALADALGISRSPINQALGLLEEKGVLERKNNRGYFVSQKVKNSTIKEIGKVEFNQNDVVTGVYFQIAEDRLKNKLPDEFAESLIKQKYSLTASQVTAVLNRISQEGWIQKKPGYGWEFTPMLTTPESLLQSYRLRLALEPAALLEPGYKISQKVINQCKAAEYHLLEGGIETDTALELHDRGVQFHESIVEASGNAFFIDAIRRVNRLRRLISYRSMKDRKRYKEHCLQHIEILNLLEKAKNVEASELLRKHLNSTLKNHQKISKILNS